MKKINRFLLGDVMKCSINFIADKGVGNILTGYSKCRERNAFNEETMYNFFIINVLNLHSLYVHQYIYINLKL